MSHTEYQHRISLALAALGISADDVARTGLPLFMEARELALAETDADGSAHHLVPPAAQAWRAMKLGAQRDGIVLEIVSAFRDLQAQSAIIRDKLDRRMPLERIFTLSAPPGYSESLQKLRERILNSHVFILYGEEHAGKLIMAARAHWFE